MTDKAQIKSFVHIAKKKSFSISCFMEIFWVEFDVFVCGICVYSSNTVSKLYIFEESIQNISL